MGKPMSTERLTAEQARAKGYTVDKGQDPIWYKGARFDPDEWGDIISEDERRLCETLATMLKMLVALRVVAADAEPNPIEILAAAEHWMETRKTELERRSTESVQPSDGAYSG